MTHQVGDDLRRSEEHYRKLVETAPDVIYSLSPDATFTSLSPSFETITGWPRDEWIGRSFADIVHLEDLPLAVERFQQGMRGEIPPPYELRVRNRSGDYLVGEFRSIPQVDNGRVVGKIGIARDVTARRRTEERLKSREQQQAAVATIGQRALASPDLGELLQEAAGLVRQTLHADLCSVLELLPQQGGFRLRAGAGWPKGFAGSIAEGINTSSQAGYTLDTGGPTLSEDLPHETRFSTSQALKDLGVRSGMSVPISGYERPFGVIETYTRSSRVFNRDDLNFLQAIANVLAAAIERERVASELRASRDQLEVILQEVADGITVRDRSDHMVYANNAAVRMLGYASTDELLAAPSGEITAKFEIMDESGMPVSPDRLPGRRTLGGEAGQQMTVRFRILATGEERWALVKSSPVYDEHGEVRLAISVMQDITAAKRAETTEHRLAAIVESSSDAIIGKSLDGIITSWNRGAQRLYGYTPEEVVGKSIEVLVPKSGPNDVPMIMARLRRGERIKSYETTRAKKDGTLVNVSLSISPVRDESGRITGAATIARDITDKKHAEHERALLLAREREARAHAEEAADRTARLQAVTAALGEALTPADAGAVIVREGIAALDASAGFVVLLSPDRTQLQRIAALGYPEQALPGFERIALDAPYPVAESVRRHAPVWIGSQTDWQQHFPERAVERGTIGNEASAAIPLVAENRVIGALLINFAQPRVFLDPEKAFMVALAQQCAQALERARLYEAERQARARSEETQRRLAFLAEASSVLGASLDYETTLASVARLAVPEIGDWCRVDIVEDDGSVRSLAVAHTDPSRLHLADEVERRFPFDPNADSGTAYAIRTGKSQLIREISPEQIAAAVPDPESRALLEKLQLSSLLTVPLVARGRSLGAITLAMAESGRHYDAGDLALAEDLARRAGIAVDNARLYRQTQEALRLREEFLSIASHELRTPLTSLQLQVQILQRFTAQAGTDGGVPLGRLPRERLENSLRAAERQVKRLSKLIGDLLDVSRIAAGRFELEPGEMDLTELAREVIDRFGEEQRASGSSVNLVAHGSVVGVWDRFRLDQVITNLLSNAIRYGGGNPIDVLVERIDDEAQLLIRDRGLGIAPEDLPRIFDRFERALSPQNYGGLGLGLYIARQIVEAHGGSVSAISEPGIGSTFTVELPLQPQGVPAAHSEASSGRPNRERE